MENILKYAEMAWNPMNAVRFHLSKGTLKPIPTMIAYMTIVIGCNIAYMSAYTFFLESLEFATAIEEGVVTSQPFMKNSFAQKFISSLGVILPALTIYLVPRHRFKPFGRPASFSCLIILAASWAFYGAVLGIPALILSGLAIVSDPEFGMLLFQILSVMVSSCVLILVFFFWIWSFRILKLSVSTVSLIVFLVIIVQLILGILIYGLMS